MNVTSATRFRIRPAREADVPALCDLLEELFAIESDFRSDRSRQRRGLSALLNAGGERARVFVAEQRAEVVGMASCQVLISTAEGGPVGVVEDVVVRKDRRGLGIGTRLLQTVEKWAADGGLRRLQLLADVENSEGLAFYDRQGWQLTRLTALGKSSE